MNRQNIIKNTLDKIKQLPDIKEILVQKLFLWNSMSVSTLGRRFPNISR